jgi:hypothetical protein
MSKQETLPQINKDRKALLLTVSATTGWSDWIHGELWLCSDGLLYIPLNLAKTLLHDIGLAGNREQRQNAFNHENPEILFRSQKYLWIPQTSIQRAYLHHGIITDRLRLFGENQSVRKFLWPPHDEAWQLLNETFTNWLGSQFIIG